jgi:hypothetical protein
LSQSAYEFFTFIKWHYNKKKYLLGYIRRGKRRKGTHLISILININFYTENLFIIPKLKRITEDFSTKNNTVLSEYQKSDQKNLLNILFKGIIDVKGCAIDMFGINRRDITKKSEGRVNFERQRKFFQIKFLDKPRRSAVLDQNLSCRKRLNSIFM